MSTKGERGKATDFSIAAIMAPRGPSFGHYHLQGLGNASSNTVECSSKGFVASPGLDHREFYCNTIHAPANTSRRRASYPAQIVHTLPYSYTSDSNGCGRSLEINLNLLYKYLPLTTIYDTLIIPN